MLLAGGACIQYESNEWVKKNGFLPMGNCVTTSSGDLKCNFIIHTRGPPFTMGTKESNEAQEKALNITVKNVLTTAHEKRCICSISIPPISTGPKGFPIHKCAEIMLTACVEWLELVDSKTELQDIRICSDNGEIV